MDGGGDGVEGMEGERGWKGWRGRGMAVEGEGGGVEWMDGVGEGVEWMEKKRGRWTESTSDHW